MESGEIIYKKIIKLKKMRNWKIAIKDYLKEIN